MESNSDTAATRASELILDDGVDMMLAIATPEMINPVADQCEANGVPCLSTLAPWQPYFFRRGGDPAVGFEWTYHFFWGAEQLVGVFVEMWDASETNKVVGLLCPNDPDGNALADPETGFPAGATAAGYTVVDPGRFQVLSRRLLGDHRPVQGGERRGRRRHPAASRLRDVLDAGRAAGLPPEGRDDGEGDPLPGGGRSARRSRQRPRDRDLVDTWPSVHELAHRRRARRSSPTSTPQSTGNQWTQFLGFVHALFEETFDVLARAGSTDKAAIAAAAGATTLDTIVGPLQYGTEGLPKNISTTSLVGGQWQETDGGEFEFDLVVTNNKLSPEIPLTGDLQPLA